MSNAEITVPARAASQYDDLLKQKKKTRERRILNGCSRCI